MASNTVPTRGGIQLCDSKKRLNVQVVWTRPRAIRAILGNHWLGKLDVGIGRQLGTAVVFFGGPK